MNILDFAVILILALAVWRGHNKGLILTLFGLVSVFVAIFIAYQIYPHVGRLLRTTGMYDYIKQSVIAAMDLEEHIHDLTLKAQADLINSLPLPDFLLKALQTNNNPTIYEILDVSSIADYIGGYIANIILNVISFALVFVVTHVILKLIVNALNIISKLPGINMFNKAGGCVAGLFSGVIIIWAIFAVTTLFNIQASGSEFFRLLNESFIAKALYENNALLKRLLEIIP